MICSRASVPIQTEPRTMVGYAPQAPSQARGFATSLPNRERFGNCPSRLRTRCHRSHLPPRTYRNTFGSCRAISTRTCTQHFESHSAATVAERLHVARPLFPPRATVPIRFTTAPAQGRCCLMRACMCQVFALKSICAPPNFADNRLNTSNAWDGHERCIKL